MKTITVNVKLTFECFDHESDLEATAEIIESINVILETELPDICVTLSHPTMVGN